jgi:hypothetical protein
MTATTTDSRSLYRRLVDADVKIDNHRSDLYFPVTKLTREIVRQAVADGIIGRHVTTTFTNQVEGGLWFDATFQYTPFWEARERKK